MITVLVADRSQADLYTTAVAGAALHKQITLKNPAAHLHVSELVSDRPGRALNRVAGVHQSFGERHTIRDQTTQKFLRAVGKELNKMLDRNDCVGLFLIASPRLLSELRKQLPHNKREHVLGEIPRDLMHRTPQFISERMQAATKRMQWIRGSLASSAP